MVLVYEARSSGLPRSASRSRSSGARELLWIAWGLWLGWVEAPGAVAAAVTSETAAASGKEQDGSDGS